MSLRLLRQIYTHTVESLDPKQLVLPFVENFAKEVTNDITLLCLGKAAVPMALAAKEVFGMGIVDEVVVAPTLPKDAPPSWIASCHPNLGPKSLIAGNALLPAAQNATGHILAMVSGGGSALAAVPKPGLAFAHKCALVASLSRAGVPISELNVVRSALSAVKGGALAQAAKVPITTLVASDVVGDDLATVASGPTIVASAQTDRALDIVTKALGENIGDPAVEFLARQRPVPPAPRPQDRSILVAGLSTLANCATKYVHELGATPHSLGAALQGTVHDLADELLCQAAKPGIWVGAGEATISLPDVTGVGGRAQHLALLMARRLRGKRGICVLIAGTDGIDGNSPAAGAVVDGNTWREIRSAGVDPDACLSTFDAHRALSSVGATVTTGPTGVNHADLFLVEFE